MVVAAVREGGYRAVLEVEERGVAALCVPLVVEVEGRRPHAASHAARDESRGVHLVRHLVVHDAAAQFSDQLFGTAWAVEEVGVGARRDETQAAELLIDDEAAHLLHDGIEAGRVADDEHGAGLLGGDGHRLAVLQRQRHRLLNDSVLPVSCGDLQVFHVHPVGRGDVDGIHVRTLAEGLGIGERLAAEVCLEPVAMLLVQVGCSGHPDVGVLRQRGQHPAAGAPQSDHAEAELRPVHRASVPGYYAGQSGLPAATLRRSAVWSNQGSSAGMSTASDLIA